MQSVQNSNYVPSMLIVEDDKVTCEMLSTVIQKKYPDMAIYLAENGKIGVERLREHAPEIVITDINMPVMDGIEMAREMKSIKANTKFIVMTAYSDRGYQEKFREIGFNDYLVKPIRFGRLFAAIEKCIEEICGNDPSS